MVTTASLPGKALSRKPSGVGKHSRLFLVRKASHAVCASGSIAFPARFTGRCIIYVEVVYVSKNAPLTTSTLGCSRSESFFQVSRTRPRSPNPRRTTKSERPFTARGRVFCISTCRGLSFILKQTLINGVGPGGGEGIGNVTKLLDCLAGLPPDPD